MTISLQLLPTQSWHLRDTYSHLLPLTDTTFLTSQGCEQERATPNFKFWQIQQQLEDKLQLEFQPVTPISPRSGLQPNEVFFPLMKEQGRKILDITINQANNRIYCLVSSTQELTGAISLHVLRYHFDSYTTQLGEKCGEVVLPPLRSPALPNFADLDAVEDWENFWRNITAYDQLLQLTLNDPINGGFKGQYLSAYSAFTPYHFLFTSGDYLYVVYPVWNTLAKLHDTIAVYQVMCSFHECTGLLENTYLLMPPLNAVNGPTLELSLRTGIFKLDRNWIFVNQRVDLEKVRQTPVNIPKVFVPDGYLNDSYNPTILNAFLYPPQIFFTSLDGSDLPELRLTTADLQYTAIQDKYMANDGIPLLANMDYTTICVDSTQCWLYGLHEHKAQQYKIEYAGVELRHPLSGEWYPLSDLTFPGWNFGTSVEFRVRNLAQQTRLCNISIQSVQARTVTFSSVEGGNRVANFNLTPAILEAQQVSDSLWMHDDRTTFTAWSEFPIKVIYSLDLL